MAEMKFVSADAALLHIIYSFDLHPAGRHVCPIGNGGQNAREKKDQKGRYLYG